MVPRATGPIDANKLVRDVLKVPSIAARVAALKLSEAQITAALPILLAVAAEENDPASAQLLYRTSFDVEPDGTVVRTKVLTTQGAKASYLTTNVLSLPFYGINFETDVKFKKNAERQEISQGFARIMREGESKTVLGYYVYGEQGTGKTFLLKRFARLLAEKGKTVAFMPVYEIVNALRQSFAIKGELINVLKAADYLFLDDIGDETIQSWCRDEVLIVVLAYRLANHKVTFFGSHYDWKVLEKIESRTTGERYVDQYKAQRLVELIRALTIPFHLTVKP